MSPLVPVVLTLPNLALVVSVPVPACKVTLPPANKVDKADPVMLPVLDTSKSFGSSSQLPACPRGARVLTLVASAMRKSVAEVSMNPPSPPCSPPLALMLPSTCVRLLALFRSAMMSMRPPLPALLAAASALIRLVGASSILWLALKRMVPPSLTNPVAEIAPLFLTTPPSKPLAACADKMISPPGACTALPLSTRVSMVAGATSTLVSCPLLLSCS